MSTVSVAEIREKIEQLCASVSETGEEVVIQRSGQPDVMLVRAGPENRKRRTARLMAKPAYGEELLEAANRSRRGEAVSVSFEELRRILNVDADRS